MNQRLDEKATQSAELEMQQVQKSLLQRELEHFHAMLVETYSTAITAPNGMVAKEKEETFRRQQDGIQSNVESTRADLAKQTAKTAKLSADLERLQLSVARIQQRLDELNRRSTQLEFPPESK